MNLRSIIGHENIKEHIGRAIERDMFSHAHIFSGEDGIGKSLVAKAAALKLLGKDKEKEYADIVEYRTPKNKRSIGVNEIRELIEEINKKPVEGDKKIIIIHEAQDMTQEAQNAFLKTIEEPPRGIYMILLCDNLESVLDTIKSRCQVYKFQRLDESHMISFIKREFPKFQEEEVKAIISFSDGIPGRAERFVNDSALKEIRDVTEEILTNIKRKEKDEILKYEDFLVKYKSEWQEVLTWFLSYIRDALVYKETGNDELLINIDKLGCIKILAESFSFNKLSDIIDIVKAARQKLDRNVNPGLVFDLMLLKMQEV